MFTLLGTLLLLSAIPGWVYLGAGLLAFTTVEDAVNEIDALKQTEMYTKNYSYENVCWIYGNNKNTFDFQEFIFMDKEEVFDKIPDLKRTIYENRSKKLYTLNLYFKNGTCVKAEYIRPYDKNYLYGYKDLKKEFFHVSSDVDSRPIDFYVTFYDSESYFVEDGVARMYITAMSCGENYPVSITNKCKF